MGYKTSSLSTARLHHRLTFRLFSMERDSIDELISVIHESFAYFSKMGIRCLSVTGPAIELEQQIQKGHCLIALSHHQIIGTITYYPPAFTSGCRCFDNVKTASFGQFAILPSFQKRGIGDLLLTFTETMAEEDQAHYLALSTPREAKWLLRYYQTRGYSTQQFVTWPSALYESSILSKWLKD